MKNRLVICRISSPLPEAVLTAVPPGRIALLARRPAEKRDQSIAAEALLRAMLSDELGRSPGSFVIERPRGKKPCCAGVEFSLSHTDGAVCAALGTSPCGADIEKLRPAKMHAARACFSDGELRYMSDDPDTAFWELWTRREAAFKCGCDGETRTWLVDGFAVSLGGFECEPEMVTLAALAEKLSVL